MAETIQESARIVYLLKKIAFLEGIVDGLLKNG